MNQYTESVLGAIDLIVQERMKDLKFDKTVVCTIVENKGEGLYLVDDGATIFEAVSDLMSYPVGFQVNVLIPQGDYKNQKTITGRYIANTGELDKVRYMTPFDNCLDVSGNIMAEGNYKIEGKDYSNIYSLLANDESRTEIPIWEYNFPEDMMNGCPYLGLAADFLTGLSDYMPISGSYGFHLVIEGEAKENMEINRDYYFDSSDMYGNPYLFETYFRQEKVFDISNYKKLKSITLSFYQNNNFNYNLEGETKKVPFEYIDITGKHKMPDNIMAKNLYLFLGYNLSDFEKDTVLLFTTSDSTYDFEIPETGKKDMKITWIRKDGSTTYIQEEEDLTPSIRIHWYIKDKTSKADPIAGDGWKEISNGFSNFTYIDYQLPNLKTEETRIKVIITEGSFDETHSVIEEAARINNKYESNTLIFTSSKDVPDETTIDVLTGLELKIINDTYQGNYRIYGEDKKLKNTTEGSRVRSLIPVLKLGEKEVELTKDDIVTWIVPHAATMINLVSQYQGNDVFVKVEQPGNIAKLDYKINNLYLETNINNTIECIVKHQGNDYKKQITLYFGTTGTAGTDFTFVIEPEEGFDAYTRNSGKSFKLFAKLYDYNDEPVEWTKENIKWEWVEPKINHAFSRDETTASAASITLIPEDGPEKTLTEDEYRYNMIKATVTTKVLYQTEKPQVDENGNYIDENGNIVADEKLAARKEEERNVSMTAYYSIPVRTKEEYYISGATYVVYDSAGANPSYNKGAYRIFGVDESVDPIWKVVFLEKDIAPYVPQIVVKEGSYKLSPKTMYIQDMPQEIAIICYYETKDEEENIAQHPLWCQPLMIWQNQYGSTLLNEWNGSLTINENDGIILSTMVGAGKKEKDNTFSGVLMGDVEKGSGDKAIKELGLYGYHHGAQSFGFRVDGTAFLGKSGKGQILFDGNDGIIQSADFTNAGMKINLNDGILETKNDGGSLKIDPTKASELFRIKGPDGKTLLLVGNGDYYLQSSNYVKGSTGMRIDLRNGKIDSKNFQMNEAGQITTQHITATGGSISGWTINETSIASNDGNMILGADGTIKSNNGNFSVTSLGYLTAKSGSIGNWSINSGSISNGITSLSASGHLTLNGRSFDSYSTGVRYNGFFAATGGISTTTLTDYNHQTSIGIGNLISLVNSIQYKASQSDLDDLAKRVAALGG